MKRLPKRLRRRYIAVKIKCNKDLIEKIIYHTVLTSIIQLFGEYIASKTGGGVNYIEARDLIMAAGMSYGKPRNVASHIYRMMRDSSDWEWVSPGTFRYLKVKPSLFNQ